MILITERYANFENNSDIEVKVNNLVNNVNIQQWMAKFYILAC